MLSFKPTFSLSSFAFIKRLFSSSSLSAIRVVSSAYLRLLIFLLAILILACVSSSLVFQGCLNTMYCQQTKVSLLRNPKVNIDFRNIDTCIKQSGLSSQTYKPRHSFSSNPNLITYSSTIFPNSVSSTYHPSLLAIISKSERGLEFPQVRGITCQE